MTEKQITGTDVLSFIDQAQIGGIFQASLTDGFPLLYANDYYYQLHGYTKEEFETLFHNQAHNVVVPEDIAAVSQKLQDAMDKKQTSVTLEYRVLRKDGRRAWLHASAGLTYTNGKALLSGMVINIDERKNYEQQLIWSEKRFQTAIEQTRINVWEYDFASGSIIQSEKAGRFHKNGSVIPNVPDSQIESRVIHPDDAQKYAALYTRLRQGKKQACAVIRILGADRKYRWEKITYTNILSDTGVPVRAVAVSEDISSQVEAEQRYYQEEYLREMLSADMLLSVKVNLSSNKVLYIWSNAYEKENMEGILSYESLFYSIAEHITHKNDKKRYLEQFSKDALSRAAMENQSSIYGEFRCTRRTGQIIWCAFRLMIISDPVTAEQVGILYIRDIDDRKKTELALQERAERDALTGLYNRQTVESMIHQRMFRHQSSADQCALFIIDMDAFKQVNDRHGHFVGDRLLQEIGRILREDSYGKCIAGRLGGDEFLIYADGVPNKQWATDLAEQICQRLNVQYVVDGKTLYTSASVGLVTAPCKDANFKEMFQQADAALYQAKSGGKATYVYFQDTQAPLHQTYILRDGCVARQHLGEQCMIDHVDDSVFVIDDATHDVLFMNQVARKTFDIEDYHGKKCYDILQGFSHPCVFCQSHLPGDKEFKIWEHRNTRLHKRFMIRDKIIRWDNRRVRLEIFTDMSRREFLMEAKIKAEKVLLECISILLTTCSLDAAIQAVMENLGKFYEADRAYFAKSQDMRTVLISDKDWHSPQASVITGENQRLEQSDLHRWLCGLRTVRVALFNSLEQMRDLYPVKYSVLQEKGVISFAAAAVFDEDGSLVGYIGIENPRSNLDNTTLLKSLSYFMQNEISKRNMREKQCFVDRHDPATGLLNWKSYTQCFSKIHPDAISSLGILMIDIHHLHLLNLEYGVDSGDRLLQSLARNLQEIFPNQTAFRLSGDSFAVLCQDITYESFFSQTHRLQQKMDREYPGSIIIGSAWTDVDIEPSQLQSHAYDNLSLAKQKRKECTTMDSRLRAIRLQRLKKALQEHQFQVYLQPKAQISSGKICGVEALVRYVDEKHGVVTPAKFIPQLEAGNNIRHIDFFVLESVCAMVCSWKKRGLPTLPVTLNFSRYTLAEENIVDKINEVVDKYKVERSSLGIEITESAGDMERRRLIEVSQQIVACGYRLYLDDFGSQYSNISILTSLPLHGLKFDKSVINDLYSNPATRLLVKNLIYACKEMKIDSIAEGVEEQEQLEILKAFGCTFAQGYLYNKPIPMADFEHKYLEVPMLTGQV